MTKLRNGPKNFVWEKRVRRKNGFYDTLGFSYFSFVFFIMVVFLTAGGGIVSWRLFGFHLARFN